MAPELWRRAMIQVRRELARLRGLSERELRRRVRLSYIKVAEYQHRGALHFHAVMRLDAAGDTVAAPPDGFDCELLAAAVKAAVERVSVDSPGPESADDLPSRELRWGRQLEIRGLEVGDDGRLDARWAGSLAKYATKSTEVVGGLMPPLTAETLRDLRVREHVRRLVECAWRLG